MRNFVVILVLGLMVIGAAQYTSHAADKQTENKESVAFKNDTLTIETSAKKTHSLKVEVAETQAQREQGLQGRKEIPDGTGMLFLFSEDTYIEMWMKNTPMSLDMLFLDSDGKIVHIAAKTKPESTDIISARRDTRGVLELSGGTSEKLGIKVGDQVVYSYFKK